MFGGYEEKPKYNAPPAKEETILPKKNERIVFNLEDDDEKIGGKHIIDRDRPTTFSRSSEQKNKPMFDEDDDEQMRLFIERRKRLRGLNMKLQNPAELGELETEPAYKRRNIDLEDLPHSSESNVSKYSLYEDENARTELKRRNQFIADPELNDSRQFQFRIYRAVTNILLQKHDYQTLLPYLLNTYEQFTQKEFLKNKGQHGVKLEMFTYIINQIKQNMSNY